jgi:hypothetical protein
MDKSQTTSLEADREYLRGMEVSDEGDVAAEIVRMISTNSEDDYYAVKYGRRMIEALVRVRIAEFLLDQMGGKHVKA